MQRWRKSARAASIAVVLVFAFLTAARAQSCDENNPAGPAGNTQIALGTSDFTNEARDDMRSFIVTGSLGQVTAKIVGQTPTGIVQSLTATPQISQLSPNYGEQLKGIDIHVALKRGDRSAVVWVSLRQVCAQYFRTTFLY